MSILNCNILHNIVKHKIVSAERKFVMLRMSRIAKTNSAAYRILLIDMFKYSSWATSIFSVLIFTNFIQNSFSWTINGVISLFSGS